MSPKLELVSVEPRVPPVVEIVEEAIDIPAIFPLTPKIAAILAKS